MRGCLRDYSLKIGLAEVTVTQIDEARNRGNIVFSKLGTFLYDNDFRLRWENDVIIKGDDVEKKSTKFM